MSEMTYNIIRRAYAHDAHRGARSNIARTVRQIQSNMNDKRDEARRERLLFNDDKKGA